MLKIILPLEELLHSIASEAVALQSLSARGALCCPMTRFFECPNLDFAVAVLLRCAAVARCSAVSIGSEATSAA